jgi:phosphoribosylanthranilate isomerase
VTWVKICGITTEAAAQAAVEAGADALGFVFWPESRRWVNRENARRIIRGLPEGIARVGVWVDAPFEDVIDEARYLRLSHIQMHGAETPDYIAELPLPVIRGLRLRSDADLDRLEPWLGCWGILVEPYVGGTAGGAGVVLNHELAIRARDRLRALGYAGQFILAGGLTPDRVADAIARVAPDGVDVSSGVETDGSRDLEKVRLFLRGVR